MKFRFLDSVVWVPVYAQVDLKDATITLQDGTGSPESVTVKIGEGNLTYNESRNMQYTLDRGTLDEVREGDEVPIDVRMDFVWEYLQAESSGGTATIEEALKQEGAAAAWISTDADTCRPYALDIIIVVAPSPSACGDKETITLSDFRWESLDHDLRAGTVAVSGKCNVTRATLLRETQ